MLFFFFYVQAVIKVSLGCKKTQKGKEMLVLVLVRYQAGTTNLHTNLIGILYGILLIVIRADGDLWYDENIVECLFTIWFHGTNINGLKYVISDILGMTLSLLEDVVLQVEPGAVYHLVCVVQYLEQVTI